MGAWTWRGRRGGEAGGRCQAGEEERGEGGQGEGARGEGGEAKPIELYYWPTPNGFKISIMLEECKLPYTMIPVNISKGEQFKPDFLKISPNNRMPAIVDPDGPGGTADLDLRVRRDPAISRAQDRQILSGATSARASRSSNGCSGRWAASARWRGRCITSRTTRVETLDLRHQPLRRRGQPALRRDEHPARGPRLHRRQIFDRRHGAGRLGQRLAAPGPGHQRVSQSQALARTR